MIPPPVDSEFHGLYVVNYFEAGGWGESHWTVLAAEDSAIEAYRWWSAVPGWDAKVYKLSSLFPPDEHRGYECIDCCTSLADGEAFESRCYACAKGLRAPEGP